MARHADPKILAGLSVCCCAQHGPLQRGTNENTYGLLRQCFPKGTDLGKHGSDDFEAVAIALNGRPRKTLDWRIPAEALDVLMMMAQDRGVATIG